MTFYFDLGSEWEKEGDGIWGKGFEERRTKICTSVSVVQA